MLQTDLDNNFGKLGRTPETNKLDFGGDPDYFVDQRSFPGFFTMIDRP